MNKTILRTGVFFGLLSVILGAFGSHVLQGSIPGRALEAYRTGVEYQMYHALLLLVLGGTDFLAENDKKWVFRTLLCGVICFSFSLYLLAMDTLLPLDVRSIGFVTPVGGLLLIAGWVLMAYRIYKPLN